MQRRIHKGGRLAAIIHFNYLQLGDDERRPESEELGEIAPSLIM
jgi:hypothetical protein